MTVLRLLLSVILLAVVTRPALPVGELLGFRTQLSVLNSLSVPYTGALVLRVNSDGIVNGKYESDSIRPDPLYGRLIPVTGSVSGDHVMLQIGIGTGGFSINGTVNGRGITGSATRGGQVWTFTAVRVHLRNPPVQT